MCTCVHSLMLACPCMCVEAADNMMAALATTLSLGESARVFRLGGKHVYQQWHHLSCPTASLCNRGNLELTVLLLQPPKG